MNTRIQTYPLPNNCLHHDHEHHQLVIAVRGQAEFEIAGRGGRVDALHGCLVPASEVHFYEGIGDNDHMVIDMPSLDISTELQRLFERPLYFEADASLRLLLAYIQRESSMWNLFPEAAEGVATGLLATLYKHLHADQLALATPVRGKLDLAAIEAYIQLHLNEPLPVARLADIAHVSPGHFHELFRDATGMTPYQYLLDARLKRARSLLLETRLSLPDIAEQVGFSSQSALTHAFRRQFGLTPGRLRRLH